MPLGCDERLGIDDGKSEGIGLGASPGVGSLSTQSVPFQQNPLPQSQMNTKSLSNIEQSQSTLLQVFGNCGVPSQHDVSVAMPPLSEQNPIAGDSVGLGVVGMSGPGTGAGVGSGTGEEVGFCTHAVPSQHDPSAHSQ